MIKNIDSLKDKAKNCADRNNLSIQQVLQNYMFERFLDRLSQSRYNNNFVIKGGLLLSSIMGINMRTTMDIDIDITGINFEKDVIEKIIGEIIEIDGNDGVTILLNKVEDNYSLEVTKKYKDKSEILNYQKADKLQLYSGDNLDHDGFIIYNNQVFYSD